MPTLPFSTRTLRILGALVISGALMTGAYVLSGPSFFSSRIVGAESTEELLREYSEKDTDGDNLPDWQEALYGTDPAVADTDGDGISDGEAAASGLLTTQRFVTDQSQLPVSVSDIPGVTPAPGSLTEKFSRSFFESYVANWTGTPLTKEQQDALVARLLTEFSEEAKVGLVSKYSSASVQTDSSVSVTAYAGAIENIIRRNEVAEGSGNAVLLAQVFIENSDRSALPKLQTLARSYRAITDGLIATRVPPHLADEHVTLIRATDTLANAINTLVRYEQDPLAVLGGLSIIGPASKDMMLSLRAVGREVKALGTPAPGAPGALLVNVAELSAGL